MIVLCLNCGSSSVKYLLYNWTKKTTLASGIIERVTASGSAIYHEVPGRETFVLKRECPDHKTAIQLCLDTLIHSENGVIKSTNEISAVGHRVVHGGEKFAKSVIITDEILNTFKEISDLAPLHNPPNIMGIEAAKEVMPSIPHMAIMDTAWHQTMPDKSFIYALPYDWYENYGVRRYGFHGTSFLYNAKRAAVLLGKNPFKCNLIICHIGNGASVNAVKDGLSYDTSMGMTPLEGLVMVTRAGDHDATIDFYMMRKENISPKEMDDILNKKSGVYGITGKYTDRRDIEIAAEKGEKRAQLSIDIESYRIKKYIGAYAAALGRVDAVVFTAGVGERGPVIREKILKNMEFMGIKYDKDRNFWSFTRNAETEITPPGCKVKVFVIPTDEEMVFVEDVVALSKSKYDIHTNFSYTFQKPEYRNHLRDSTFIKELKKRPDLIKVAVNLPKELISKK
jgi:acetate kinase